MCDDERHENIDEYVRHLLDLLEYKNREIAELKANNPPPGMRDQYTELQKLIPQYRERLSSCEAELREVKDKNAQLQKDLHFSRTNVNKMND